MRKPLLAAIAISSAAALAAGPHEHGLAQVDIAVDAQRITVTLETPLQNLLGFERAPRSDAERRAVADLAARLRNASTLFRIDAGGACRAGQVELQSTALGWGAAAAPAGPPARRKDADDAHADLDASFEFNCASAARAGHIDLGLFDAFARLSRIEVQLATSKGQTRSTLRRPASRVLLGR